MACIYKLRVYHNNSTIVALQDVKKERSTTTKYLNVLTGTQKNEIKNMENNNEYF